MYIRALSTLLKSSLVLLLLHPAPTLAEQAKQFGKYIVHYNALQTSFLTPKVARDNNIKRSANRIMLNVSVLEEADDHSTRAIPAAVWVNATNLSGQQRQISMRPIHESDAIYYIGELPVANEETLNFAINVQPTGETRTFSVQYREQFFTN